jgi:hypothetical protein
VAAPTVPDLGLTVGEQDQARLEQTLAGAVAYVARHCGPFATSAAWTKTVITAGGPVMLRVPALLAVSSAVAAGVTVPVLEVDPLDSSCVLPRGRRQAVTFTGTQGHPGGEPEQMRLAAIALAQHWWLHREGLTAPRRPDGYTPAPLSGYGVPRAVKELMRSVPGTVPVIG